MADDNNPVHPCAQYCRKGQFGEVRLGTGSESSEGQAHDQECGMHLSSTELISK